MRIWLVTIGEPVPVGDGSADRLHRTGTLARMLSAQGHKVTWWTSTFDHFRKRHLFHADREIFWDGGTRIVLLRGCGYSRNISFQRFIDHHLVAKKFAVRSQAETVRPDTIIAALPTIELCMEAVRYGERNDVPVVLDMRDMWPDIFVDLFPRPLRPLAGLALTPLFRQARAACRRASAIVGITSPFVDWGLKMGERARTGSDRAFPLAYDAAPPAVDAVRLASDYWDSLGVFPTPHPFNVCYIGSIGHQLDLKACVDAARILHQRGSNVRFVLCGTGDRLSDFKGAAQGLDNVLFPGWINAAQIHVLMRRSHVGLDPLPDRYDFLATINNKAIEYFSAGLPVLSSPASGILADLLRKNRCGLSYPTGAANELARVLDDLQANRSVLARMSQQARTVFTSQFTAEKVYAEMAQHLVEVTTRYRQSGCVVSQ